jgi:hypothetical protein
MGRVEANLQRPANGPRMRNVTTLDPIDAKEHARLVSWRALHVLHVQLDESTLKPSRGIEGLGDRYHPSRFGSPDAAPQSARTSGNREVPCGVLLTARGGIAA